MNIIDSPPHPRPNYAWAPDPEAARHERSRRIGHAADAIRDAKEALLAGNRSRAFRKARNSDIASMLADGHTVAAVRLLKVLATGGVL